MFRFLASATLAVSLVVGVSGAQAATIFKANLTSDQEVPINTVPNQGTSGVATFVLNDARTQLSYDLVLTGFDMSLVQNNGIAPAPPNPALPTDNHVYRVHIHRNAPALNGPIVFGMIDSNVNLRNDLNNLLIDPNNRQHISGVWDLGEGANNNGTLTLGGELNNLFAGQLYINVHTGDFLGGEIRGQILAVPEPASAALLGLGLLGLFGLHGRKAA